LKKCLSIAKEQGLSESKIYSELLSMFYASGQTSKSDEIESIVLDENKPEYLRELNIRSHYLLSNSATFDSTMSKCFTISVRVRPLYIEEDTVNISRLERGSSLEFEFDTEDNSVVNKIHYKYEKKLENPLLITVKSEPLPNMKPNLIVKLKISIFDKSNNLIGEHFQLLRTDKNSFSFDTITELE